VRGCWCCRRERGPRAGGGRGCLGTACLLRSPCRASVGRGGHSLEKRAMPGQFTLSMCIYICAYIYMCVYISLCIYICIYISIYIAYRFSGSLLITALSQKRAFFSSLWLLHFFRSLRWEQQKTRLTLSPRLPLSPFPPSPSHRKRISAENREPCVALCCCQQNTPPGSDDLVPSVSSPRLLSCFSRLSCALG